MLKLRKKISKQKKQKTMLAYVKFLNPWHRSLDQNTISEKIIKLNLQPIKYWMMKLKKKLIIQKDPKQKNNT
jgi:hypothetical protein